MAFDDPLVRKTRGKKGPQRRTWQFGARESSNSVMSPLVLTFPRPATSLSPCHDSRTWVLTHTAYATWTPSSLPIRRVAIMPLCAWPIFGIERTEPLYLPCLFCECYCVKACISSEVSDDVVWAKPRRRRQGHQHRRVRRSRSPTARRSQDDANANADPPPPKELKALSSDRCLFWENAPASRRTEGHTGRDGLECGPCPD
jgi:hypothetical protein